MSQLRQNVIKLLAGSSHEELAQAIASHLGVSLSPMLNLTLTNGETTLTVGESVRDQDVFIIQTGTSRLSSNIDDKSLTGNSLSDHIMEVCLLINASKAASARRITVILPCYPYARQDKKEKSRAPITAKLMANLLTISGADHIITMDLHAGQIQGFFDIPVDNLRAEPVLAEYVQTQWPDAQERRRQAILVSPDAGGVKRATALADLLDMDFAIIHKERKKANEVARMTLVGEVRGRTAIIVDDMADTCGTLVKAAEVLKEQGATAILALVIHPVLSGEALNVIEKSPIDRLIVTNTIPLRKSANSCSKLVVLDVSNLFAEAIRRLHNGESVSSLFSHSPTK